MRGALRALQICTFEVAMAAKELEMSSWVKQVERSGMKNYERGEEYYWKDKG